MIYVIESTFEYKVSSDEVCGSVCDLILAF